MMMSPMMMITDMMMIVIPTIAIMMIMMMMMMIPNMITYSATGLRMLYLNSTTSRKFQLFPFPSLIYRNQQKCCVLLLGQLSRWYLVFSPLNGSCKEFLQLINETFVPYATGFTFTVEISLRALTTNYVMRIPLRYSELFPLFRP